MFSGIKGERMKDGIEVSIKEIQKKFGKIIAKASECKSLTVQKIPTGSLKLDWILNGGLSQKKLTEIFGAEHSFKTAFIFKLIAKNQKLCRLCGGVFENCNCNEKMKRRILYMDYEDTFGIKKSGKSWAKKCGVDLDELSIIVPSSWEEGIDIVQYVVQNNLFDIVIIDSLTQAPVTFVMERDTEDPTMGVKAARNAVFVAKLFQAFAPTDITDINESIKPAVIYIQQVRDVIGKQSSFQLPPTPTGGWALKHGKHVSIGFSSTIKLGTDGKELGQKNKPLKGRVVKFRVYKDKVDGQYLKEDSFDFYIEDVQLGQNEDIHISGGNIDTLKELIEIAIEEGFIERAGAWYKIANTDLKVCGENALIELLHFEKEVLKIIETQVYDLIYNNSRLDVFEEPVEFEDLDKTIDEEKTIKRRGRPKKNQ